MNSVFFIFIAFGAAIIVFVVWLLTFEMRLRKFFKGDDGKNLEKTLSVLTEHLEKSERRIEIFERAADNMEHRLKKSVQKTKVVRFNPFNDVGGDQSFSVSFLDEQKNGLVISSLYGREINRIYAKPIEKGKSQYQLSEEEKEAIQ